LRLVCSLILKSNVPRILRPALKNNSMALFINAERFPRIAFQGNKQVVWSRINWRLLPWYRASGSDNDQTE
jgi:hypothetical protein